MPHVTDARRFASHLLIFGLLAASGYLLWNQHARAWDLGRQSPVLSYDAAQYALAARELALHGRLATTYALPLDLARHSAPPWPLSIVQPGLVLFEALLFRITPDNPTFAGFALGQMRRPDQREWLVLILPFISFLLIAQALALAIWRLLRYHAGGIPNRWRALAAGAIGMAFLLDPEAQHFAVGGFTELPFTLGLTFAVAAIALGMPARRPFVFGLVLGIAGLFRGNMLWLAPIFAIGGAAFAPPHRRLRTGILALAGYALVLAPWWLYKWRAFGNPAWDLSALSVWDGIGGRTWFSLFHGSAMPDLPTGGAAVALIAGKIARNLPRLLLMLANGPRALEVGALVIWAMAIREPRPLRHAGWVALSLMAASLLVSAATEPLLRYLFPARVVVEAAGVLALWALIARTPGLSAAGTRIVSVAVAILVLSWGGLQTRRGLAEARIASQERGTPGTLTMLKLGSMMNREIPAGEPVMSNLGPALAWEARRPVIHLALSPDAISDCRRHMDFHNVVLVFRDVAHAWPGWSELIEHPLDAMHRPELRIRQVRRYDSEDGFIIVWLQLAPLEAQRAEAMPANAPTPE